MTTVAQRMNSFNQLLRLLNDAQRRSVEQIEGPVLVCGLPRTGTTATVGMMAVDPRYRFLRGRGRHRAAGRRHRHGAGGRGAQAARRHRLVTRGAAADARRPSHGMERGADTAQQRLSCLRHSSCASAAARRHGGALTAAWQPHARCRRLHPFPPAPRTNGMRTR